MNLARFPDWQLRLEAFVRERRALPFAWGTNDCCLFAADAVQALTGQDFAGRLRGSYSTIFGALRRLHDRGGVYAIAHNALGAAIVPRRANVGDIVMVQINGHDALGVCNGDTLFGPGPSGIVVMDMNGATAAWRVG